MPDDKKKRRKISKAKKESRPQHATYIGKMQKKIHGNSLSISRNALVTLDGMVEHMIGKIVTVGASATKYHGSTTFNAKAALAAGTITIPGRLRQRALDTSTDVLKKLKGN
tara:strand:- start:84 stop:416 length:333 start_codon:yes stop_codon:yes gene_type:complete